MAAEGTSSSWQADVRAAGQLLLSPDPLVQQRCGTALFDAWYKSGVAFARGQMAGGPLHMSGCRLALG